MAPSEGPIQPAVGLREGVRGDEYPTPSHPLFPAGASFRGQVDTLGTQRVGLEAWKSCAGRCDYWCVLYVSVTRLST